MEVSVTLPYLLRKRTKACVSVDDQRGNGGAHAQTNGLVDPNGASRSASRAVARTGVRPRF